MRKLGIAILIIVIIVVLAALIVPHMINVNKYHDKIQAEVEKKLGRQVTLGDMHLSLLPPAFKVANVVIGEDKNFDTGRPFAAAQQLSVSVKFWPLLRKQVDIRSLELDQPHIELVRNAQGQWNFASLGHEENAAPVPETAANQPASAAKTKAGKNPNPPSNTQTAPAQSAKIKPSPKPEATPAENKSSEEISLANLQIKDGQVAITDQQKHQSRAVYDHIDVSLSNFAPDKEFSIKASARLPGQGSQAISLDGTAGPIQQADMLNTKFDGNLRMNQVSIAGIEKYLNSQALSGIEAQISGDAKIKNADGKLSSSGTIKLDNPQIRNVKVGYPISLDYDVADDLKNDVIQINRGNLKLGSTPLTIAGTLNTRPTPAQIDMKVTAPNAPIGEIVRLASAFGGQEISGSGTISLNVKAQGPTSNLNLDGNGKIQNASLKMPSATKPVDIHNTDITFSQNAANLQNISVTVGQTNANGSVTLKNFSAPAVQFTLNADKVNVPELQQIFGATPAEPAKRAFAEPGFWHLVPRAEAQTTARQQPGMLDKMTGTGTVTIGTVQDNDLVLNNVRSNVTINHGIIQMNPLTSTLYGGQETGSITMDMRPAQPVYTVNLKTDKVDANKLVSSVTSIKQMIYGLLASNVNASFSSGGNDIARTLNGTLGVDLTNGKLANLDLLHELASVGKFVSGFSGAAPKGFTNLVQLSGNFDVKNGVAQTNDLKAVIDGGTLAAKGLVNLADQSLNLHVTAILNSALSKAAGGTQVGGFMNTALANNQGELVIPVIITGTFQHPQVAPDVQQVAQMKLQNLLPTSKNPGALTSGILGALSGKGQGKGGIGGILGGLAGQQQNQNQQQQNNGSVGNNSGQQQQPPANQNPLGNALGQILGKKKQQNQNQNQNQQKPPQ
jgi:AsmA protein